MKDYGSFLPLWKTGSSDGFEIKENLVVIQRANSEVKFPSKKSLLAPGVFTVLSGVLALFALSLLVEQKVDVTNEYVEKNSSPWLSLFKDSNMLFTLKRVGYDPLFYFNPDTVSSYLKYKILDDYIGIIEPYVDNELFIFGSYSGDDVYYYQYEICSVDDEKDCYSGIQYISGKSSVVNIPCTAYDKYTISMKKITMDGDETVSESSGSLLCMNVRREMRELSYKDLQEIMDTMKVLWDVDDDKVRRLCS